MSIFKFSKLEENFYQKSNTKILEEGEYNFEISGSSIEQSKSEKNPGINMVKIIIEIIFNDNPEKSIKIFDYLLDLDHSLAKKKIFDLFFSIGMEEEYNNGFIDISYLIGKSGKCLIGIKEYKGENRNYVISYLKDDEIPFNEIPFAAFSPGSYPEFLDKSI